MFPTQQNKNSDSKTSQTQNINSVLSKPSNIVPFRHCPVPSSRPELASSGQPTFTLNRVKKRTLVFSNSGPQNNSADIAIPATLVSATPEITDPEFIPLTAAKRTRIESWVNCLGGAEIPLIQMSANSPENPHIFNEFSLGISNTKNFLINFLYYIYKIIAAYLRILSSL